MMTLTGKALSTLSLGGSVSQMIEYNQRNCTREQFIDNLVTRLAYRCKTKPAIYGTRTAALIGLIYDQFEGDTDLLDIVIESIHKANEVIES